MLPKVYLVHEADNVVTALEPVPSGMAAITGAARDKTLFVTEEVRDGHKIALKDIPEGTDIRKYNVRIGKALRGIKTGEWVHIHNMVSCVDETPQHVDAETGAVKDTPYV